MTHKPHPLIGDHYHRARPANEVRRAALFGVADARGNNPHQTRESADAEGRRRNAGRYETVEQMDRALAGVPPGSQPAGDPVGDFLGFLVKAAVAVTAAVVVGKLVSGKKEEGEDDFVDGELGELRQNPWDPMHERRPRRPLLPAAATPSASSVTPGVPQLGVPVMMFQAPSAPPVIEPTAVLPASKKTKVEVTSPVPVDVKVTEPKAPKKRRLKNKGQFNSKSAKAARKLVERPGPVPGAKAARLAAQGDG